VDGRRHRVHIEDKGQYNGCGIARRSLSGRNLPCEVTEKEIAKELSIDDKFDSDIRTIYIMETICSALIVEGELKQRNKAK